MNINIKAKSPQMRIKLYLNVGHAVEVVCLSFCLLMVLFLRVMWMIYCMDDMMAFTVVFNILRRKNQ